ncbi:hypothetical protein L228DRAFT_91328 [Xylona heveae TC161]|uniref:Uncharacterized protein n=1 Tax=Xylona heveae (strain CBS 132557 / TC161) TaxID=1328760 RepID=A0A161TE44_XYLHT|nr:hypothetical protein L228DRAFT_91328 [Xylona heveae TC161]KZF24187.1 hypothetical protein L228DRAFT_91328 [Xylona heveae TC161]
MGKLVIDSVIELLRRLEGIGFEIAKSEWPKWRVSHFALRLLSFLRIRQGSFWRLSLVSLPPMLRPLATVANPVVSNFVFLAEAAKIPFSNTWIRTPPNLPLNAFFLFVSFTHYKCFHTFEALYVRGTKKFIHQFAVGSATILLSNLPSYVHTASAST